MLCSALARSDTALAMLPDHIYRYNSPTRMSQVTHSCSFPAFWHPSAQLLGPAVQILRSAADAITSKKLLPSYGSQASPNQCIATHVLWEGCFFPHHVDSDCCGAPMQAPQLLPQQVPQASEREAMSWQEYVDDHLLCELPNGGVLTAGAIVGQDGGVWAQNSAFPNIEQSEASHHPLPTLVHALRFFTFPAITLTGYPCTPLALSFVKSNSCSLRRGHNV